MITCCHFLSATDFVGPITMSSDKKPSIPANKQTGRVTQDGVRNTQQKSFSTAGNKDKISKPKPGGGR